MDWFKWNIFLLIYIFKKLSRVTVSKEMLSSSVTQADIFRLLSSLECCLGLCCLGQHHVLECQRQMKKNLGEIMNSGKNAHVPFLILEKHTTPSLDLWEALL